MWRSQYRRPRGQEYYCDCATTKQAQAHPKAHLPNDALGSVLLSRWGDACAMHSALSQFQFRPPSIRRLPAADSSRVRSVRLDSRGQCCPSSRDKYAPCCSPAEIRSYRSRKQKRLLSCLARPKKMKRPPAALPARPFRLLLRRQDSSDGDRKVLLHHHVQNLIHSLRKGERRGRRGGADVMLTTRSALSCGKELSKQRGTQGPAPAHHGPLCSVFKTRRRSRTRRRAADTIASSGAGEQTNNRRFNYFPSGPGTCLG